MCERKIKICDAYDKIYTKQSTSVLAGQHRSDRSGWAAPVRPVPLTGQTGQVQPEHKAKSVRAIWSRVIRPGLQASLDHFATQTIHIQYMHHNLAIKSLK
jgi:hypothetical protein